MWWVHRLQAESEDFLNDYLCVDSRRLSRQCKHKMIHNLYFGHLVCQQELIPEHLPTPKCALSYWICISIRFDLLIMFEETTPPRCHFINSSFVCHKLKFPPLSLSLSPLSLSLSLCPFLSVSLSFHAVAREAGRMRSLAAAEGHRKNQETWRKHAVLIECVRRVWVLTPSRTHFTSETRELASAKRRISALFLHCLIWQGRDISCLYLIGWPLPLCSEPSF